ARTGSADQTRNQVRRLRPRRDSSASGSRQVPTGTRPGPWGTEPPPVRRPRPPAVSDFSALVRSKSVVNGFEAFDNMPKVIDAEAHEMIQNFQLDRLHKNARQRS